MAEGTLWSSEAALAKDEWRATASNTVNASRENFGVLVMIKIFDGQHRNFLLSFAHGAVQNSATRSESFHLFADVFKSIL
jgi:hypothetical protein